jgi:putative NIF3 family GTP cyclohydrolase 1 type 2
MTTCGNRTMSIAAVLALCLPVAAPMPAAAADAPVTARAIVDRIKDRVGVPWQEQTVDTFKAGDPATHVTGIAVTMMATLDVLQRAAASGRNLVITHEPTFFDHRDPTDALEAEHDPVLAAKLAFIRDHHLVIWRLHDHWHRRAPDGIEVGVLRALGWQSFQQKDTPWLLTLPETTVAALAADIRDKLHAPTLRVVGDRALKVSRVALLPGAAGFETHRHALQRNDVEVLVIGEAREWETVEYVADAGAARQHKALVIVGHIPSEQAGMEECTRWLRTFVSEVPVDFVPAADPFWQPGH